MMDLAGNINISGTNLSLKFPLNLTFDEYIFDNSAVRLGLYVVYTAVFCLCFFGNLVVIIVVTCHWRMRSVTKFCMGNLAFANLCVAVFCIYQNLSTFLQENWIFGRFLCKMYHFTNSLSHSASILILVVICGERYLSIVHPLRCRRMLTIQRLRVTIVGVWVLSGVISSPRLYYITTFEVPIPIGPDGHHDVICAPKRTLYDSRTTDMIYFIVLFLLPLLVMSVLYTKIGSIIWKSSAVLQASTNFSSYNNNTSSRGAVMDGINPSVAEQLRGDTTPPPVPQNSLVSEASSGQPTRSMRSNNNGPDEPSTSTHRLRVGMCLPACSPISSIHHHYRCDKENKLSFHHLSSSRRQIENNNISSSKRMKRSSTSSSSSSSGNGSMNNSKKTQQSIIMKGRKGEGMRSGKNSRVSNPPNGFCSCADDSSNRRKWRIFQSPSSTTAATNNATKPQRSQCGMEYGKIKLSLQGPAGVSRVKDERRGQVLQSRQAAIRMLIAIVITFALCNFPYHLRKICQYYMTNYNLWSSFNQFINPVTFLLMYTNCAVNPILYAFMSKNFRSSLKDLLQLRLTRPMPGAARCGRGRVSF